MNQAQERQHNQPCEDCTKCGGPRVWKLRKSGRWKRYCSPCATAESTKWSRANPEKSRETRRRYKEANPEKVNESVRRWRAANPEKAREVERRWAEANPEKNAAKAARYRARRVNAADDGWSFETLTKMVRTGEHTCFICERATATDVEHLVPVSLGGGNTWDNLGMACGPCNKSKGGDNRRDHMYPGSPGWEAFLAERRA